MKKHTAPETWDAWLLSHGLRNTYEEVKASHEKRETESPHDKKKYFCFHDYFLTSV